jgi:choline dehydrogenase
MRQQTARNAAPALKVWNGQELVTATATREVILCAGSIGTPQILQLSGIGPGALLQQHGIAPGA